jgi:hypothetical protein
MSASQLRFTSAGLLSLVIFLSGYWLNRLGKPYPPIPLNVHKLIGLATVIFLGWHVARLHRAIPFGPGQMAAVVITGLFFAITIIAGGLVSIPKPMPAVIPIAHKLFPYLTVLSTVLTLVLLLLRPK